MLRGKTVRQRGKCFESSVGIVGKCEGPLFQKVRDSI